jgi:hypothetical protein
MLRVEGMMPYVHPGFDPVSHPFHDYRPQVLPRRALRMRRSVLMFKSPQNASAAH